MPESSIIVPSLVKPILKKDSSDSTPVFLSSRYKKVWFDSVAINYHKIILGDNPAVSDGAPVTIGWDAHDVEIIDVDCFEATRPKAKKLSSLKLAVEDRAAMLLQNGYTIKQLAKTLQQVEEIQRQRAESCEMSKWDRLLNEFAQSSGKIFRKMTKLTPGVTSRPSKKANPAA